MIAMLLRGTAISLFTLVPLVAVAQTAAPASVGFTAERLKRVDALVERMMKAGEITGAVTLIARDGKIVHLQAQGVMDADNQKPMQKDSFFRMASMTKPVAATALLMLVEEGKVRLNDPVSKYLPSYRNLQVAVPRPARTGATPGSAAPAAAFYAVPAEREVTLLDLLTHTSGIMSGPHGNAGGQASFRRRHEIGLAWVDNLGTESVLEFQPGTRWAYSPVAGLDISNRVVEVVTGKPFNEFIQERLFRPLKMKETVYWPSAAQRERLVTAYTFANGQLTKNPDPDSMSSPVYFSGGGGLMSTAESYARFAMMLANGGELEGARILSPATVGLMGSRIIPDSLPGRRPGEGYGLGVRHIDDRAARRTLLSNGSFGWSGAYGTHFWVDPSKRLAAILLVQTPSPGPPGEGRTEDFETVVMQALTD
jgi:CubicO group peptidase (beta-lactamase class C family)